MDLLASNLNIKEHTLISKKGGETTYRLYGKKHFSEAGKKGMKKRWGHKQDAMSRKKV